MELDDSVSIARTREECYRLLAACFYLPEKEILDADNFFPALSSHLARTFPSATRFSDRMRESLAVYSEEELAVEYSKLFVGPFELKAPPYGSVYLDGNRTVMGASTGDVHQFYLSCGLKLADDFHELPDHIAVELEFMSYLIHQQSAATAAGNVKEAERFARLQEKFLEKYLVPWLGGFCSAIREGCDNQFYRALADTLEAVAQHDHARLASGTTVHH
ncbi:MAG: molecular chaperone TorD family protein [Desulfuromonadales bacterium]